MVAGFIVLLKPCAIIDYARTVQKFQPQLKMDIKEDGIQ